MAITYVLGTEPIWYLVNGNGTAAGGASLYTYDNLTRLPKIVYMDALASVEWTNPIVFDADGTQGPFYFSIDSGTPGDAYFLIAKDSQGNELWTRENYTPGSGGGGGGGTVNNEITNYISNGQMIDNLGTEDTDTTNFLSIVVAPSNHKGFTPYTSVPIMGANGAVGPDIMFLKGATVNTDKISFPLFALSDAPMAAGGFDDITPVDYLRYQCTTSNVGENYKSFQFPITQKIKNLSNQSMTFKVWAAVESGTNTIQPKIRQYFGSGTSTSVEVCSDIGSPLTLTTTWTPFYVNFIVPSVAGKSIGTLGSQTDDDALYIQLWMPVDQSCTILFTKPALYLGNIQPKQDFSDYDQIDSVNQTPRTGEVKTSYLTTAPRGWIAMNDGSIGNTGSAASIANAKGAHAFALYKTIWDGVIDAWAPVSTGRGATALADFLANKTLTLPRSLGRALAGAGSGAGLTARVLGEYLGSEIITTAAMPAHTHTIPFSFASTNAASGASFNAAIGGTTTTSSTGSGAADGNMEPTSFMNVFIKL